MIEVPCSQCGAALTPGEQAVITCPYCKAETYTIFRKYICSHCQKPIVSIAQEHVRAVACEHCKKLTFLEPPPYSLNCRVEPPPISLGTSLEWKGTTYTFVSYVVYQWWAFQEQKTGKIEVYTAVSNDGKYLRIQPVIPLARDAEEPQQVLVLDKLQKEVLKKWETRRKEVYNLTDLWMALDLSEHWNRKSFWNAFIVALRPIQVWGSILKVQPWYEPAMASVAYPEEHEAEPDMDEYENIDEYLEALDDEKRREAFLRRRSLAEVFDIKRTSEDIIFPTCFHYGEKMSFSSWAKLSKGTFPGDFSSAFPHASVEEFSPLSGDGPTERFVFPEGRLIPETSTKKGVGQKGQSGGCLSLLLLLLLLLLGSLW